MPLFQYICAQDGTATLALSIGKKDIIRLTLKIVKRLNSRLEADTWHITHVRVVFSSNSRNVKLILKMKNVFSPSTLPT